MNFHYSNYLLVFLSLFICLSFSLCLKLSFYLFVFLYLFLNCPFISVSFCVSFCLSLSVFTSVFLNAITSVYLKSNQAVFCLLSNSIMSFSPFCHIPFISQTFRLSIPLKLKKTSKMLNILENLSLLISSFIFLRYQKKFQNLFIDEKFVENV